jgi:hypothetical protein
MILAESSFLNENGLVAYQDYMAFKRHFTSSYDYFKYNGKVNVSYETFCIRKDAYSFQRLSKKKDYKNLILSNIVETPKLWVGDLLEEKANEVYMAWKRRNDAITSHVQDNLGKLSDDFKSNFVSNQGQYPKIIDLYLRKEISLETVCILTKLTNSQEYWAKSVVDNVMFPDIMKKLDKYHPFLVYSKEKVKKVIKDHFF